MEFPAVRFPGVGADVLRRRTGQLRDAPRQGERDRGQRRERRVWVGAVYFGTGSIRTGKREAHRAQWASTSPWVTVTIGGLQ